MYSVSSIANVKMDTIAIKLMIKKAIAFVLISLSLIIISSINLKKVIEPRQEKITNNTIGIKIDK